MTGDDKALVEELAGALDRALAFEVENDVRAGETTHEERCAIARAILPILTTREAAARAEGRREGIEEAAKVAEASPYNNGLNDAPMAVAIAIRARLGKKP